jgi:hypothetical protein
MNCFHAHLHPKRHSDETTDTDRENGCTTGSRPIGCKVKRESRAFLDEFSAGLVAGGQRPAWQRLMAPMHLCLRRRLRMIIYSQPVFFAWFRHTLHTPSCQGRAGASQSSCAKRLLPLAYHALVLALTGGVNCAGRNRATTPVSPSRSVWWTTQLWPQRQHLLNCRQRPRCSAAPDVR